MLKRRLKDAGLSDAFSPHSFRATGITNYLENGGTLEVAQRTVTPYRATQGKLR
jgi:integrase/recombinase XerD